MRVLTQRDKHIRELQEKLDAASASVGELTTQVETVTGNAAAKEQSLGEQLTALTTERDEAQKQLTVAQADLLKFQALKDHPELLPLADAIPALPDEEAMKEYLQMMAKGVTDIATQKAQQLTAGMTPGPTAPDNQPTYACASLDEWQIALNNAAGEPEFAEIAAAFRQWEAKQ
jgi:seryl-tRNA synthetase